MKRHDTSATSNDGRSRGAAAQHLRPVRELRTVVFRYFGLVVLVGALTGAGVVLASYSRADPTTATSRVGITERVQWPFYDAERERLVEFASKPDFRRQVADRLPTGEELVDVRVDKPVDQAYVNVVARASSNRGAVSAADVAGELLVAQSRERIQRNGQTRLDQANTRLAEVDRQMAALDGQNDAELQDRRSGELALRAVLLREREEAAMDLVKGATGNVEVLRSAEVTAAARADVGKQGLLGALAASLVTALAAVFYDSRYARIRSTRHARSVGVGDLPLITATSGPGESDPLVLTERVLEVRPPRCVLGVAEAREAESWDTVTELVHGIRAAGGRVVTVGTEAESPAGRTLSLSELLSDHHRRPDELVAHVDSALADSRGVHLQVEPRVAVASAVLADGLVPFLKQLSESADLMIVHLGPIDDAGRTRLPERLAEVVVISATAKRTRQRALRRAISALAGHGVQVLGIVLRTRSRVSEEPAAKQEELPVPAPIEADRTPVGSGSPGTSGT
ncbi:hypothetical protein [Saccharopolyspora sp. NPDC002376]